MREMNIESVRASVVSYQRVVILKEKIADRYLPIWIGPAEADAIAMKLQNVTAPRPLTHDLLSSTIKVLGGGINFIVVDDIRNDTFYAKVFVSFNDGSSVTRVKFSPEGTEHRAYTQKAKLSFTWRGKEYEAERISEWREPCKRFFEVVYEDDVLFELCHDEALDQWLLSKMKIDSRPSDAIALAVRTGAPIYVEEPVLDKAGVIFDPKTGEPILASEAGKSGGELSEEELRKLSAFKDVIDNLNLDDLGKEKPEDK